MGPSGPHRGTPQSYRPHFGISPCALRNNSTTAAKLSTQTGRLCPGALRLQTFRAGVASISTASRPGAHFFGGKCAAQDTAAAAASAATVRVCSLLRCAIRRRGVSSHAFLDPSLRAPLMRALVSVPVLGGLDPGHARSPPPKHRRPPSEPSPTRLPGIADAPHVTDWQDFGSELEARCHLEGTIGGYFDLSWSRCLSTCVVLAPQARTGCSVLWNHAHSPWPASRILSYCTPHHQAALEVRAGGVVGPHGCVGALLPGRPRSWAEGGGRKP